MLAEPVYQLTDLAAQQQPLGGVVEQQMVRHSERIDAAGPGGLHEHAAAKEFPDGPIRFVDRREVRTRDGQTERSDCALAQLSQHAFTGECPFAWGEDSLPPVDVE